MSHQPTFPIYETSLGSHWPSRINFAGRVPQPGESHARARSGAQPGDERTCGTWREPLVVGTSAIDREPRSFLVWRILGSGLRALGVSYSLAFSYAREPDVGRSRFDP